MVSKKPLTTKNILYVKATHQGIDDCGRSPLPPAVRNRPYSSALRSFLGRFHRHREHEDLTATIAAACRIAFEMKMKRPEWGDGLEHRDLFQKLKFFFW